MIINKLENILSLLVNSFQITNWYKARPLTPLTAVEIKTIVDSFKQRVMD